MTVPLPRNRIVVGDAAHELDRLPPASVDMVLTSPPYFRLRDYGIAGQLGLESAVDDWVDQLARVAASVARVLTPTGTLWLNVADSYSTHPRQGAGRKSLLLGPERLALRLVADGWLLRNKVVWRKTNPMPTSTRDRLAATWEAVYVFSRRPDYFFDLDAIRMPHLTTPTAGSGRTVNRMDHAWRGPNSGSISGLDRLKARGIVGHPLGKNPGDVWDIASARSGGHHHATFPLSLALRAIAAGAPEARCVICHRPHRRAVLRSLGGTAVRGALHPDCACDAGSEPGVVLDPFIGSGTTAIAAEQLSRDWLGIELNPAFAVLAKTRVDGARAGPSKRAAA